ncbi:hypothetical protein FEM33_10320 [Dyadobacter flavalbus]|uniref:Uncharacterized protein n=1 Tax=Dyadobacter flavalbus TaxID=2579942 RepID=A0A5M8QWX4_9BACT|nr:hypothetical protein [Dyadobacter flavalbus]KAA6439838.1 hypothetical protein FEM33_10320 [Dyadobacter flavalbus]
MKAKAIKFFSPQENNSKVEVSKPKLTGYISGSGKIILPVIALQELDIEAEKARFKIGTDQGKRKFKSVYLIPSEDENETFALVKSGRGYVIPLGKILKQGGIDFENNKYTFAINPFHYDEGVVGYELTLSSEEPAAPATGKRRGRKPKIAADQVEQA